MNITSRPVSVTGARAHKISPIAKREERSGGVERGEGLGREEGPADIIPELFPACLSAERPRSRGCATRSRLVVFSRVAFLVSLSFSRSRVCIRGRDTANFISAPNRYAPKRMPVTYSSFVSSGFLIILATFLPYRVSAKHGRSVRDKKKKGYLIPRARAPTRASLNKNYSEIKSARVRDDRARKFELFFSLRTDRIIV